jgi:hypothetical protein
MTGLSITLPGLPGRCRSPHTQLREPRDQLAAIDPSRA